MVCVFDEEEKMYMPDFDVTVLYEGEVDAQNMALYEQDGIVITLANWLNGRMQIEAIERRMRSKDCQCNRLTGFIRKNG